MRKTLTIIPMVALTFGLVGCARTDEAATTPAGQQQTTEMTAEQRADRDHYINQMEQRIAGLEQKLTEMRNQPAARRISQDRIERLQDSVKELREEVAELRNANTGNWWTMTERSLQRERDDVQADIDRRAGTGTRGRTEATANTQQQQQQQQEQQQQTGTADAQQREQFVSRMESEIQQLEQQLNQVAQRSTARNRDEVEDAREQLNELRQEVTAVRNMNEQTWWDSTKARLDRAANRVERSLERMGNNDNQNRRDTNTR